MPFLSFIVGFRNRDTERVRLFMESLSAINGDDYELVFVDYGSDESVSQSVRSIVSNYSFANYYFFNSRGQNWNRAKCLNYGYSISKGQYVFTSDIDFLYSKDFVEIIKAIASPTKSFYFKVGFLTEKQSQAIHFDSDKYEIERYSDVDAVGALLISREMYNEVGGYDEFYEIWGVEDNDLLHRIKMTKNQITFYNEETIIWHIWHLPIKQSSVLPDGWLKYLKDYFEFKKQNIVIPNQNYYCKIDVNRPIIYNKNDIIFKSIKLNCSDKFIQYALKEELLKINSHEGISLSFDFSAYISVEKSRLNKIINLLNVFLNKNFSSISVYNSNMDLYLNDKQATTAVQYFIKNNIDLISDFFIPNDISKESILILKR